MFGAMPIAVEVDADHRMTTRAFLFHVHFHGGTVKACKLARLLDVADTLGVGAHGYAASLLHVVSHISLAAMACLASMQAIALQRAFITTFSRALRSMMSAPLMTW